MKFLKEIFFGIFQVIGATLETKTGLGMFFLICGLGILLSETDDTDIIKTKILGLALTILALYIFYLRYKEIKNEKIKKS